MGSLVPPPLRLPNLSNKGLHPSIPLKVKQGEWKEGSRRVGAIAIKKGMTSLWDRSGARIPITVLQLRQCQVVQVRTRDTDGFFSLQLGAGGKSTSRLQKKVVNHFSKHGVPVKRCVREFKVTEDALLPPGFEIRSEHFVPGQHIDIQGISIGKGFQGPMKRWGFAGLPASHGVSVSHRSHGSTGNRQDPGRVWRGKKMAGRMGGDRITVLNLKVVKVDTVLNLLYVRGCIPGHKESFVRIRDSNYKPFPSPPPFPSFVRTRETSLPRELVAPEMVQPPMDHVENNWREEERLEKEEKKDRERKAKK